MSQTLRELLEENELLDHVEELERDGFTPKTLGMLTDGEVADIAKEWPRGNRIRFANLCRTLRSGPTELAGRAVHGGKSDCARPSLSSEVRDNLPTPLAAPAADLLDAASVRDMIEASDLVLDFLLRTVGLICEADYLHSEGWFDRELNDMFPELERATLGKWRGFIGIAVRSSTHAGHPLFLGELTETWSRTEEDRPIPHEGVAYNEYRQPIQRQGKLGLLEWLICRRNDYHHMRIPDRRDPDKAGEYRDMAIRALQEYGWLCRYELWMGQPGGGLLLRGAVPRRAPDAPPELSGNRDIVLRSPSQPSHRDSRSLRMPPLIIAASSIFESEAADEASRIMLYNTFSARGVINYTCHRRSVNTQSTLRELNSRQERKAYPRLRREELTPEEARTRIATATARAFRGLAETGKYRRETHVERREHESMLFGWIHSQVPLLGVASEAGAGKTGVLANLARTWREQGETGVLLMLARDFETLGTFDRAFREALHLKDGVTALQISRLIGGLVIVLDGLNEHPQRDNLLDGICTCAQDSLGRSAGVRFALSWRTEDASWIRPALDQANLWWSPLVKPSSNLKHSALPRRTAAASSGRRTESPAATASAQEPSSSEGSLPFDAQTSAAESADPAYGGDAGPERSLPRAFILPGFTQAEVEQAWNRHRSASPETMRPRFDWTEIAARNRELADELRNPLRMRIALEAYHDCPLPPDVRVEQLFGIHLDGLRRIHPDVGPLIATIGRLMHRGCTSRVPLHLLESEPHGENLVWSSRGVSAFDILVAHGSLSLLDDGGGQTCCFTIERVSEQVLAEHLLSLTDPNNPISFAAVAEQFVRSGSNLASGAIRASLDIRLANADPVESLAFLQALIDANPPSVDVVTASAMARLLVRSETGGFDQVTAALTRRMDDPTLKVARSTGEALLQRRHVLLARKFLSGFMTSHSLERMSGSIAAANLGVAWLQAMLDPDPTDSRTYLQEILFKQRGMIEGLLAQLRLLAESDLEGDGHEPWCSALGHVGSAASIAGLHPWALDCLHLLAGLRESRKIPGQRELNRRKLTVALSNLGWALRRAGRFEEAIETHQREHDYVTTPESLSDWDERATLRRLAECHEAAGRPQEAVPIRLEILESTKLLNDRVEVAATIEALAQTLLKAKRWEEAISAFEDACRAASQPNRLRKWSSVPSRTGIALARRAMNQTPMAIEELRRAAAADRDARLNEDSALTYSLLADFLSGIGNQDAELQSRRLAVELARQTTSSHLLANTLSRLGGTAIEAGDFLQAIDAFKESLAVGPASEHADEWSKMASLAGLGRSLLEAGRPAEGLP